jgi:AcrR family transcriptional regulator
MERVKCPYRSRHRREQAEATRRQILASARTLFTSEGYAGATMEAIARHAGVAVQTVYAIYGSKRAILFALLDEMAVDADRMRMEARLAETSGDARQQLRAGLAFNIRFYTRGADLIELARTVSGVEPDLGAMWREGEARRRRAQSALIASWDRAGRLAPGLTAREASDVMWALSGPDVYRLLVIERGWSLRRFERWLSETLERSLLDPGAK